MSKSRPEVARLTGSMASVIALVTCLCIMGSVCPASAVEPMPEVLQRLVHIFPERDGWFVEEPLGVAPGTPEKARPFFETFRVVVPDVGKLELAVARLLASPDALPIKKVERYDRKDGSPGLPGYRAVWCRTEDGDIGGVSLMTPNQNRFLIWARHQYYPAFGNDSIPTKVRDWYARSVGQYFASLDAGVPDTEPPRADARELPEWMDLFRSRPADLPGPDSDLSRRSSVEIRAWDLHDVVAFRPTEEALRKFAGNAPDTLWENTAFPLLQHQLRTFSDGGGHPTWIRSLTATTTDSLLCCRGARNGQPASGYYFAVDRYGRVRYLASVPNHDSMMENIGELHDRSSAHGLLFPGAPVLASGTFMLNKTEDAYAIRRVLIGPSNCFTPILTDTSGAETPTPSDEFLESLGHFFSALRGISDSLLHPNGVTISKY